MNRISNLLIGLTVLLCISCDKKTEKETPNGFKFTVVKSGDGVLPKKEEILVFDYVLKDSKDSIWNDTHEAGMPSAVMIKDSAMIAGENGMLQMFRMLSKGDSVTAKIPVSKFFAEIIGAPIPPGVDTTMDISYCIQVNDIMKMESFTVYQQELMETKRVKQVTKDASEIEKYLTENKITAQQDTSGLQYVLHSSKGGSKPGIDNCVEVKYRGRFMKGGKVFDEAEQVAFPLSGVIRGWQLGIPMLGIGDSATFYIPSGLAYGPQGYPGAIPPDAVLIFDVELLGFGGEFDQTTRTCK